MPQQRQAHISQSGFALVAVLLFLALAATIVTPFVLEARTERVIQSGLYRTRQLDLLADGLIDLVAAGLLSGQSRREKSAIPLNAENVSCAAGPLTISLHVQDHAGLVDLNAAPAPLIAAGLVALGVSRTDASEIAAIVERYRRPMAGRRSDPPVRRAVRGGLKGGPFESAVELSDIAGLDGFGQARLNRYFTVHGRASRVARERAPRELAAVLAIVGGSQGGTPLDPPALPLALTVDVAVRDAAGVVGRADYVLRATPGDWPGYHRVERIVPVDVPVATDFMDSDCRDIFGPAAVSFLEDFP